MSESKDKGRGWKGLALFSYGFRPFFLGGTIFAALAMMLWMGTLEGYATLPTRFDPISWHAHEFLFGFLGAVIAGFLLTAVPNWTGRKPITGYPLVLLFSLWCAGRLGIAFSNGFPATAVALADLAMPAMLIVVMGREIVEGRNWRSLPVLVLICLQMLGNALFHWETAHGEFAAQGYGFRLGLATAILLIGLIGGRIVPAFTRNWLVKRGGTHLPASPMGKFDILALTVLLVALAVWVGWPNSDAAGATLLAAGMLHMARLARWSGFRTFAEPLVWILHVGYGFLPLGAIVLGASLIWPDSFGRYFAPAAAQHLWMAGAIGVMTLAVMTRATLGHTGRSLSAGGGTTVVYLCLVTAAVSRSLVDCLPVSATLLYSVSAAGWTMAFGGFAVLYGPALCGMRGKPKAGC